MPGKQLGRKELNVQFGAKGGGGVVVESPVLPLTQGAGSYLLDAARHAPMLHATVAANDHSRLREPVATDETRSGKRLAHDETGFVRIVQEHFEHALYCIVLDWFPVFWRGPLCIVNGVLRERPG